MSLSKSLFLLLSGGLIASSIMLSKIGLSRSALSKSSASVLSGVGAGAGTAIFIYYGVSNGDLLGSIIVGIVTAFTVGIVVRIPSRWWR